MVKVQTPRPETLTVSELTAQIKRALEQGFPEICVLGETSGLRHQPSGHVYFTIKDEGASLAAVIWKSTALRLARPPEEGQQYIFTGHLSLYPPQGRYQLVVSRLEAAGGGALAAEFERRKKLFSERGWFAPENKRAIPPLPRHIGIVTSRSAAALEDVKKVLASRPGWLRLTVSPTLVQGSAAAPQIARAIKRLQAMKDRPDVILLVRGGGSPEDLWCFNGETVVRAVVECTIPVIAGIGHEIDVSLTDFAADCRAATPSNAAELACPDRETLHGQLPRMALLRQLLEQTLAHAGRGMDNQQSRLTLAWRLARDERRMHIERGGNRLYAAWRERMESRRRNIHSLSGCLHRQEPHSALRNRQRRLATVRQRLSATSSMVIKHPWRQMDRVRQLSRLLRPDITRRAKRQLETQCGRLDALNPVAVLERGYSMAQMPDGGIVTSVEALHPGDALIVRFHKGHADTRIEHLHRNRK